MSEKLLEVRNLRTYFYTMRDVVRAVDGVNLDMNSGEGLGLAGESGCGKSTLAYSIVRLVPPPGRIVDGQVIFKGIDILKMDESEFRKKVRWRGISMIFQGAMNALNPVYTIGDQLAEVLMLHENLTKREALEEASRLLEMVGIERKRLKSYPHELSGGMKQRVVIAMALALKPPLVIADEPTTALDVVVQAQIMNLLKKLKKELQLSIMLISHDLSIIAEIADKLTIMYGGRIVERGPSDSVYLDPKHPYTQGLLGAIPRLKGELRSLAWIPGAPPDLTRPPPGCRFAPRCKYASERCQKDPHEVEVGKDHYVACWLYA
ncbi:MAG: ABC transporter ATP-binding protein [Desulfurococcaceae archaeon]